MPGRRTFSGKAGDHRQAREPLARKRCSSDEPHGDIGRYEHAAVMRTGFPDQSKLVRFRRSTGLRSRTASSADSDPLASLVVTT